MLIDRSQPEGTSLTVLSQQGPHSSSAQGPPEEIKRTEDPVIADQVLVSQQADTRLGDIRLKNERQNGAAAAIRETDRAVQELGQKIDSMKAPLQAIVKNFPPFSPEDKERMELLRSYTALRKEIDQLTIPPPPPAVADRQLAQLPEPLGMRADDSQIADHLDKLDAVSAALGAYRAGIAADTAEFVASGRFSGMFSAGTGAESAGLPLFADDSAAARQSSEVGRQFAMSVGQGVAIRHPQFLKGLS